MITKIAQKKRQKFHKTSSFLLIIFLFLIDISLFFLIKSNFFESLDIQITGKLKDFFNNSNNNNYNEIINSAIPLLIKIFHFLNEIYIPYIIIIIINNYSNVYKSFILITILSVSLYFTTLIKLLYNTSTYHKRNDECGLASNEIIIFVSFYLSLWEILINSKDKIEEEDSNNFYNIQNKKSKIKIKIICFFH